MYNKKLILLGTAAIMAFGTDSLGAQNLNFLRESPIAWLDDNDEAILRATIDSVLEAPDGTATDWQNPATGAKGRVQVLDTHEAYDTSCRRIKMRNEAKGRKSGGTYRLCRSDDGRWRFAPNDDAAAAVKPATKN